MATTLPFSQVNECCVTCDDPVTVQVPGPAGADGANGTNGTNGENGYTTFTASFTMPAEGASAVASVASTAWMAINQIVYAAKSDGSVVGYLQVTAIATAISCTLKNIESTASSEYLPNSAPGAIFTSGSRISPAGIQGPVGAITGAASGDLKGTYPGAQIGIGNTKGSSLWGNGTDTVAVPAATNGHMLAYDSTDAEGIKSMAALPLTGGTDVLDNRIARLDGTTGLPIPMQSSKVTVNDNGAVTSDGSGGNARGTDATDLQVNRAGATAVASGARSFIGGGNNNTASGIESVVAGGESNTAGAGTNASVLGGISNLASGASSMVGGGEQNTASASYAGVGCGYTNIANAAAAFVGGGEANTASGVRSSVCSGLSNVASALYSFVGAGTGNQSTNTGAAVVGGATNLASGLYSSILGGLGSSATADYAAVVGGTQAVANKHGQVAHSAGMFASAGDSQVSDLVWRIATSDATANVEMFLDGATVRAVIASGTAWAFTGLIVGKKTGASAVAWKFEGLLVNVGGTTTGLGITVTAIDNTLATGVPSVDADNGNDALRIRVTGIIATNIRWTASARLTEVAYT